MGWRWNCESFPEYGREVELRYKVTNLQVTKRASAPVLRMEPTARDVCMTFGSDHLMEPDAAATVVQMLHDYFAPDALDVVYQDVVSSLHFEGPAQSMGEYLVKFDLLRRKAESRV